MNKYLKKYIEAAKIIHCNDAITIQDMNFHHVYVTSGYLKLTLQSEPIIGKRYNEVETKSRITEYAQKVLAISNYVNKTGYKARYITANFIANDNTSCYLVEESLIIDPETNEKVGRLIKIEVLDVSLMWQVLHTTNNFKSNKPQNETKNYPVVINNQVNVETPTLTEREREILFLMIIGEKYKSIAYILSNVYEKEIKETSIKTLIHKQLFEKFNVFNNDMLIEKIIQNNLITEIPKGLLKLLDGILNVQLIPDNMASNIGQGKV